MNDISDDELPTKKRGLHFAHLNVQSIRNKFDLLKIYVTKLNFDVLALSETWLTEYMDNTLLEVPGYNFVRCDLSWSSNGHNNPKRGGGIGVYIKNTLSFSLNNMSLYNRSCNDIEMLWLELHLPFSKNVLLGTIYRPPDGNVTEFCDTLTNTVNDLSIQPNKELLLLGDFNIQYGKPGDPNAIKLIDFEHLTNMSQKITEPTRLENTIDLIYTNSDDISNAGVLDIFLSDHLLIYCTKKKAKQHFEYNSFEGRSYRNYNCDLLLNFLNDINWNAYWSFTDPNDCWQFLLDHITRCLDNMCPIKNRRNRINNNPWLSEEILESIHEKNRAWKKAKRTRDPDDIVLAKRLRNHCKTIIRRAKGDFVQDYLDDNVISLKKFWEKINYLLPRTITGNSIQLVDKENSTPVSVDQTPDFINNFFTNIGPELAKDFKLPWQDNMKHYSILDPMPKLIVTDDIVLEIVKKIDIHKSSAVKNINSTVLKDVFLNIIPQLTFMYNLSFATNTFPDLWKSATVIPLSKPGDPSDVSNLRPISLLPLPGKILERIVHTQISKYLEEASALSPQQGGFRKGKSTIDTVANFTDDVLLSINTKQYTIATFIDFKKAFDTVDHNILCKKLKYYGLHLDTISWIGSYLNNRSQTCKVNGLVSDNANISCGVPQGSILGPLLFLIYINDLQEVFQVTNFKLYADDTVLYASHSEEIVAHGYVQQDLNKVVKWCNSNKITMNIKKTKSVTFGTKNMLKTVRHYNIFCNGIEIHYVNMFNYLGIKLDNKLDFESHAKECLRLVSHKLYLVSKIRNIINKKQAITIYKSKILPYFDYGDIFYNKTYVRTTDKLQKLQNRAIRLCLGRDSRYNVLLLHQESKIPRLENRRHTHLLNFVYPRAYNDSYIDLPFIPLRRFDAPILFVHRPNNESFRRSILYQGAITWNVLPVEERAVETHTKFKNIQKNKLLNNI